MHSWSAQTGNESKRVTGIFQSRKSNLSDYSCRITNPELTRFDQVLKHAINFSLSWRRGALTFVSLIIGSKITREVGLMVERELRSPLTLSDDRKPREMTRSWMFGEDVIIVRMDTPYPPSTRSFLMRGPNSLFFRNVHSRAYACAFERRTTTW